LDRTDCSSVLYFSVFLFGFVFCPRAASYTLISSLHASRYKQPNIVWHSSKPFHNHWFIQQNIATVHRSKERETIGVGFVGQILCIFHLMQTQALLQLSLVLLALRQTTLTLSLVTPHTFHPRRCY